MRLWLHLLVLLGLAAASLHAPAMALPAALDAPSAAMAHPDCHEAADAEAAPDRPAPGCCPDGCSGGCLLPAVLMPLRLVSQPLAVPAPRLLIAVQPLHGISADPGFHPPRAFA